MKSPYQPANNLRNWMKIPGLRKEISNLPKLLVSNLLLQICLCKKFRIRFIIFIWSAQ